MTTYHTAPGHAPTVCTGPACVLCRRLDRTDPGYSEPYRRLFYPDEFPDDPPAPPPTTRTAPPPINPHSERHSLILACDYRQPLVGLERAGCGCSGGQVVCLLGLGQWPGRPTEVGYDDCLACVSPAGPRGSS
jgi:hypothetical protein